LDSEIKKVLFINTMAIIDFFVGKKIQEESHENMETGKEGT
jgi:hypothetical protein